MALDGELLARLRALIREHRMEPIEDFLLTHSAPCVTLTVANPNGPRDAEALIGASRMGGMPDLPHDFAWPTFDSIVDGELVYSGFLFQLDLSTLPQAPDNPLPKAGLLSVFHRDQCAQDFTESFEAYLFDANQLLRRTPPPTALMCASEVETCLSGEHVLIDGVLGIDTPDKGQHDIIRHALHDRFKHDVQSGSEDWIARYSRFQTLARDPDHDRFPGRYPGWRWAGQLLGRMDASSASHLALLDRGETDRLHDYEMRADRALEFLEEASARWRLLIQLETSPLTGFAGGCDAAPVLIMARADRPSPWSAIGEVRASLAP